MPTHFYAIKKSPKLKPASKVESRMAFPQVEVVDSLKDWVINHPNLLDESLVVITNDYEGFKNQGVAMMGQVAKKWMVVVKPNKDNNGGLAQTFSMVLEGVDTKK